jgi:hypothetical protein
VGEVNKNNFGSVMKVISYYRSDDVWVEFVDTGNKVHTEWRHFYEGNVRNVYDKSVFGIGYLGEGKYKTRENSKHTHQYSIWTNMLNRCYNEKFHKKQHTYIDCTVSDEWHNFQNFAKWYDANFYQIQGEKMELDKDILIKGNKVYSPETCLFVPQNINKLFLKRDSARGNFPIGVSHEVKTDKYVVTLSNSKGKVYRIGTYDTPEKAFIVYKNDKEKLIKGIAYEYKNQIPLILYNTMVNYQVEITD